MMSFPGSGRLSLSITPRVKIVAVSVAVGFALLGIFTKYFRRKKQPESKENGSVPTSQDRGETPVPPASTIPVQRWLSVHSRHRNSPSMTGLNVAAGGRDAQNSETLIYYGMENLVEAIRQWEKAAAATLDSKSPRPIADQEILESLDSILQRARVLQSDLSELVEQCSMEMADNISTTSTITPGLMAQAPEHGRRGTLSVLSDDSFVSALEELIPTFDDMDILLREPLALDPSCLFLYQQGLREVMEGNVNCRVMRTLDFTGIESDEEFLAKLWAVRRAFTLILQDDVKRDWMIQIGRTLIADLLRQAKKEPGEFYQAYDSMISFLADKQNWPLIEEEIKQRRLAAWNFYDVVLDFILMDAFEDLQKPPSAVLAVARNRFLSDSFKESTLSTVVWSVLKAKRSRLAVQDGFINHFYDISEQVSPVLAWGFMGSNQQLRQLCYYFKEQICNFISDIFSFQRVRYTSLQELCEDIWLIGRTRLETTQQRLSGELLPAES